MNLRSSTLLPTPPQPATSSSSTPNLRHQSPLASLPPAAIPFGGPNDLVHAFTAAIKDTAVNSAGHFGVHALLTAINGNNRGGWATDKERERERLEMREKIGDEREEEGKKRKEKRKQILAVRSDWRARISSSLSSLPLATYNYYVLHT